MGCMKEALQPDSGLHLKAPPLGTEVTEARDIVMTEVTGDSAKMGPNPTPGKDSAHMSAYELLFRCFTCKRLAHYAHMRFPTELSSDASVAEIAQFYQTAKAWLCGDCSSYLYGLDKILAWRPYPANAVEPLHPSNEPPNYKSPLPREYLVKWLDRSYRRTQWVPHMWLVSTNHAKLKHFLAGGSKVALLATAMEEDKPMDIDEPAPLFEIAESRASSTKPGINTPSLPQDAIPDAERRIPPAWKTVDRVLDVLLWHPRRRTGKSKKHQSKKGKRKVQRIESDDESDEELGNGIQEELDYTFDHGEQPSADLTETVSEWEARNKPSTISMINIDQVVWVFTKWDDLGYDEGN